MADRTIVHYVEPSQFSAPGYSTTLDIDRSSSGQPTLLITITVEQPNSSPRVSTIIVKNADELLTPVLDYLRRARAAQ